jgi:hypothetical protein
VVAGERYRKGGIHRCLLGAEYRNLWTTPVSLEVLDLSRYAGGLKVTRLLGHGQTKALAFTGADGQSYTFRPVIKDPGLLPEELRTPWPGPSSSIRWRPSIRPGTWSPPDCSLPRASCTTSRVS